MKTLKLPVFRAEPGRYIAAEEIETIMNETPRIMLPVIGDCMERADIEDGGWVAVDFTHMPRPPKFGEDGYVDPCLCLAVWPGLTSPTVMVKAYTGKWGQQHMVGTQYDHWKSGDYRTDVGMFAERVYGVVFASWGKDGTLLWERDVEDHPLELPTASTITGGNAGALIGRCTW